MRRYFTQKPALNETEITSAIKKWSFPLAGKEDLTPLFNRLGDSRILMLGEASQGTHEYYTWRTYITKRLIVEKGFYFIAVEGDWPDCYKINRLIKNYDQDNENVFKILHSFNRWPTCMWTNWEKAAFV